MKKIIYYKDELQDEFSEAQITPKLIDEHYDYEGGALRRVGRLFWYHVLAKPLAWCFLKIKFGHRIENKSVLKEAKKKGFFLYGNHTNAGADALIPTIIQFTGSVYVIVHANNVSMPVLGRITPSFGALPLPDTKEALKNFTQALSNKVKTGHCVTIYPEAHIWPYYTKIRPFKADSFRYPLSYDAPVYCFTNTYQKRKLRKTPRIVTYIDGPFYGNKDLPRKDQRQDIRDRVYDTMVIRSANSNVEVIQYVKEIEK